MGRLTERKGEYCFVACADIEKKYREECPIYNNCYERRMHDKLAHYEDLEEAGRLIELPCAVGDKVWLIVETENGYQIEWDMVEGIHINQYASYSLSYRLRDCIDTAQLPSIPLKAFGEVIFTTKEEAEAKLAELEGV